MKLKIGLSLVIFLLFLVSQIPSLFSNKTYFIFCNVGEGDGAILMHKQTVFLIDAGRDSRMRKCLERHLPFWVTEITGFISTHPDADHLNGIKSVMKRYSVKHFFTNFSPSAKQNSDKMGSEYREIYDALVDSGVSLKSFVEGEKISIKFPSFNFKVPNNEDPKNQDPKIPRNISIVSLWPGEMHKESEKTNLFSNVSVVTIGESRFLMLADSEIETQLDLLSEIVKHDFRGSEPEDFHGTDYADKYQSVKSVPRESSPGASGLIRENPSIGKQQDINEGGGSKFLAVKVSHHGSNKNFSLTLMKKLAPKFAIISVGKNNYGHPGGKVLKGIKTINVVNGRDRSLQHKIQILRTDEQGDVVFECENECELKHRNF